MRLANPTIWAGAGARGTHSYNQALVGQLYQSFLRRGPDSGGAAFWTDNLDSTGNYVGVSGAFVESAEYKARFPVSGPW